MTDRNESLIALAERVEGHDGRDLALNEAIAIALGATRVRDGYLYQGDKCLGSSAPAYTSSLDAAMTLVPEGWWIDAQFGENRSEVKLGRNGEWRPDPNTMGYSATPALALCAAALRARAAQ